MFQERVAVSTPLARIVVGVQKKELITGGAAVVVVVVDTAFTVKFIGLEVVVPPGPTTDSTADIV